MAAVYPPNLSIHVCGLHPPPIPSQPPSIDDVARAAFFEKDVLDAHKHGLNNADIAGAAAYKAKVVAEHAGLGPLQGGGELQPAIQEALQPIRVTLARIEESLRRTTASLDGHTASLDGHTASLGRIDGSLNDHTVLLRRIDRSLAIVERRSALLFNESRTGGADERFEVVLFPDLADPRDRGWPLLTSRAMIEGLSHVQQVAYYRAYYLDNPNRGDDYVRKLYEAIGVRRPL